MALGGVRAELQRLLEEAKLSCDLSRYRQRAAELAAEGHLEAGAAILDLPIGPEIATLHPHKVEDWKRRSDVIGKRTAIQIFAALQYHWVIRQPELSDAEAYGKLSESRDILLTDDLQDPVLLEIGVRLMLSLEPKEANTIRELKENCANAVERELSKAEGIDAATLMLIAARQSVETRDTAVSEVRNQLARAAEIFREHGDKLGVAEATNMMAESLLPRWDRESTWENAAENFVLAGALYREAGDHLNEGFSLKHAATSAMRGNLDGPVTEAAEQTLRKAATAFSNAGFRNFTHEIKRILRGEVKQQSCLGSIISVIIMALLITAFVKGSDAILILMFVGVAVLAHELGHWICALIVGIPIKRFRIGVGSRLLVFKIGQTQVEVCMIPFLGYVMPGVTTQSWFDHVAVVKRARRNGTEPPPEPKLSLKERTRPWSDLVSRPRRALFYSGGLLANFIVAFCLLWGYGLLKAKREGTKAPQAHVCLTRIATTGVVYITKLPGLIVKDLKGSDEPKKGGKDWIRKEAKKDYLALLSVLGVMNCILLYFNILPIAPLDGFHILCTGWGAVTRRDPSERTRRIIARVGFLLIGILIILNVYLIGRDVFKTILSR